MAVISKHVDHCCPMMEKLNPEDRTIEVCMSDDTWRIEIFVGNNKGKDEYGVANIAYCPFCGNRLLNSKESKGEM